jgi:RNA polymerase sigma-70 factor (ECF subfamily)
MNAGRTSHADDSSALSSGDDASGWLNEHGDALYRYARSRVGHRELAEDLVQDAFLAALASRERFEGRATVRTWLLAILRRKIVDHYRSAAESPSTAEADSTARPDSVRLRYFSARGLWKKSVRFWPAPEKALEDREFWEVLDRCLGRLPDSLAAVFVLRELEELDTAELQRTLNLSETNVRVRLHRARLMLRECLEKHWFAERHDRSGETP